MMLHDRMYAVVPLLIALVLIWMTVQGLLTGVVGLNRRRYVRGQQPVRYWTLISVSTVMSGYALHLVLRGVQLQP